jgi:hypothetical protein
MSLTPTALPTSWAGTSPQFDIRGFYTDLNSCVEFAGGREGVMDHHEELCY